MEWEYKVIIKIWYFSFLRKKDKFMIGPNAKRWAFSFQTKKGPCYTWDLI